MPTSTVEWSVPASSLTKEAAGKSRVAPVATLSARTVGGCAAISTRSSRFSSRRIVPLWYTTLKEKLSVALSAAEVVPPPPAASPAIAPAAAPLASAAAGSGGGAGAGGLLATAGVLATLAAPVQDTGAGTAGPGAERRGAAPVGPAPVGPGADRRGAGTVFTTPPQFWQNFVPVGCGTPQLEQRPCSWLLVVASASSVKVREIGTGLAGGLGGRAGGREGGAGAGPAPISGRAETRSMLMSCSRDDWWSSNCMVCS